MFHIIYAVAPSVVHSVPVLKVLIVTCHRGFAGLALLRNMRIKEYIYITTTLKLFLGKLGMTLQEIILFIMQKWYSKELVTQTI